jgi:hypothetical protein
LRLREKYGKNRKSVRSVLVKENRKTIRKGKNAPNSCEKTGKAFRR